MLDVMIWGLILASLAILGASQFFRLLAKALRAEKSKYNMEIIFGLPKPKGKTQ